VEEQILADSVSRRKKATKGSGQGIRLSASEQQVFWCAFEQMFFFLSVVPWRNQDGQMEVEKEERQLEQWRWVLEQ